MAAGEEEVVGPGAGYDAEKVREFFDKFDNDGSGNVSPEEFKELCQAMQPDMPDEDVAAALEQLDSDGDGEISFDGAAPRRDAPVQLSRTHPAHAAPRACCACAQSLPRGGRSAAMPPPRSAAIRTRRSRSPSWRAWLTPS